MALFAYYGLQFPKAKIIWFLPHMRVVQFKTMYAPIFGFGWFQFRALWVALIYLLADIVYYFVLEKTGISAISFSGHIAGFATGALFWFAMAPKSFKKEPTDILESKMDSLMARQESNTPQTGKKPPKLIE